jgi:hypothetical protein
VSRQNDRLPAVKITVVVTQSVQGYATHFLGCRTASERYPRSLGGSMSSCDHPGLADASQSGLLR